MANIPLATPKGATFAEEPSSPKYKFGQKPTMVRSFVGTRAQILAHQVGVGSIDGSWVVTSCDPENLPGNLARMVISYEAGGAGSGAELPPDERDLVPFDLQPRLERHENYAALDEADMALVRQAVDSPETTKRDEAMTALTGNAPALELVAKLLKGIETFYRAGYNYTWSKYYLDVPALTEGGLIQTPGGPLAGYIATLTGFDWLRQADTLAFTGQQYKVTRTWVGGPNGHWDSDLYPAG